MPSFLTRPKRMSNHTRRPRSGSFDPQRLKQLDKQHQQEHFEATPTPISRQSPAALILNHTGAAGSSSDSSTSEISITAIERACAESAEHHVELPRVLALSCPAETCMAWEHPRTRELDRWQPDYSGGSSGISKVEAEKEQLPSKRQRQLAWTASRVKVSSGPIDIVPPSPGGQPRSRSSFGDYGPTLTAGEEEDAILARRGRAATDAGAWYPCWPCTSPRDDDACGQGGVPPHILIWEEQVMRSASMQQQGEEERQPRQGDAEAAAGIGARRVSDGSTEEGVEGDDEDDQYWEDETQHRSERRYSSTDPVFEMDLDM